MIKLSYFPNLFIEAAVLFDQQGGCHFYGESQCFIMWLGATNSGLDMGKERRFQKVQKKMYETGKK